MTEGESWGKADDGGLGYMYGSTRRACGGRLMAVRAVCADAGEDMPELARRKKGSAPVRLGCFSGGRSSRGDVSRIAGP